MPSEIDEHFLLSVSQTPGIGAVRLKAILEVFSTIDQLENASLSSMEQVNGLGRKLAESVLSYWKDKTKVSQAKERALKQIDLMQKHQISLLTPWSKNYPELLRHIYDAPVLLFVRGKVEALSAFSISVIGTRTPTDYGKRVARTCTEYLASQGVCLVSGFAYGIDTLVHTVACEKETPTIAVLGSGVDNPYTDSKNKLTPYILERGAIVSEEFIGTPPTAENFPKRNRIISGLSKAVLIIESDINGGAMITAKYANEQDRDVLAVPGNIYSNKSRGTNKLIQQGAKPILVPEEIMEDYNHKVQQSLFPQIAERPTKHPGTLSEKEKSIVTLLLQSPRHIDEIIEESSIDISDAQTILFDLEIKNVVKQTQGKFYQLV